MRAHRSLVAILAALALLGAAQTPICPRAAGCSMQGTKAGPARGCTPAMGKDCCKPRQSPASTPHRTEDRAAKAAPALAAVPVATQMPIVRLASSPASVRKLAPQAQPVPLYTLFATLLI